MTYDEVFSSVILGLSVSPRVQHEVTRFEIGKEFDSAQRTIVQALPVHLVQEFVTFKTADGASNAYEVPLPSDFMQLVGVKYASERDTSHDPILVKANILRQDEWLARKGVTEDHIVCIMGGKLYCHPSAALAYAGSPSSVELVYKRRPEPFHNFRGSVGGAFVVMQLHASNSRMFAFPSGEDWDDYSLDDENLIGGYVTAVVNGTSYRYRITQTAVDGGLNYLVTESLFAPAIIGTFTALVQERHDPNNTVFMDEPNMGDSLELGDHYMQHLVSMIVGNLLIKKGEFDIGSMIVNNAITSLNAMGANLTYLSGPPKKGSGNDS